MIEVQTYSSSCRNPALFEERRMRLHRLLELNAPDIIVAEEARMVAEAFAGGHWRLVWRVLRVALGKFRFRWWYCTVVDPVQRMLCRFDLWHPGQEAGELGCPYCGKGEPTLEDLNGN